LTTIGNIFASQEEKILTTIINISTSQEVIEEKRIHEHLPQEEDLEVFSSYHCKHLEENKDPWETFDGEQTLEPKIE
jgi:hypothetical protein